MLNDLLARNQEWLKQHHSKEPEYIHRLEAIQTPEFLWIGSSDNQVLPNVVSGLEPAEGLVHRNAANMAPSTDMTLLSTQEFAVGALNVRAIDCSLGPGHFQKEVAE